MLEVKIEELTQAIIDLTVVIREIEAKREGMDFNPDKELTISECIASIPTIPVDKPKIEAAPVMPAAPTFEPTCPTHANAVPFTDGKGLIDYVMTVYKELGAEKGAQIQGVLTEMGLQNVNELRPTEYDAFFAKVEALK